MKTCGKCKIRKEDSEFYERRDDQGGLRSKCIPCFKIGNDKHRQKRLKTIPGYLKRTYNNIWHRCNNPKNKYYKYYGGRGIEFRFKNADEFVNYVIKKLQIDPHGLDIDRINNDGHYEPGNIRLVTHKENMQNRRPQKGIKLSERDVRMIIYMWRTGEFTQPEIAKVFGIKQPHVSNIVNGKSYKHIWRKRNA